MMDPVSIALIAGGGLSSLFGGGGSYQMSPDQRRYIDYIKNQLGKPDAELGMPAAKQ
jgi:hypothetical protein